MTMPSDLAIPRARFGLPGDQFLFAFVFDMGSTAARKNPLGVVEAYRKAFGDRGDVGLVLKVARGWQDPKTLAALKAVADGRRIHLLDEVLAPEEVHGLIGGCDAYVSLHRSEGFGLTLAEAMSLGKPTIATRYSGNLDFMSPDNSLLVDYVRAPIAASARVYRKGCLWADPSTDHAADSMRWIVAHPGEAKQLGLRARASIRETLSLAAAGERMRHRLSRI